MTSQSPEYLPTGWRLAKIGELFDSWGGHTPSKANRSYWGPGLPWISSKEVKATRLETSTYTVTQKAIDETGLRVCPAGSVLVVVRSGILAHTLPVTVTDAPVTINQDLKAFYSNEPLLNEWLALFLRMSAHQLLASSRRDGTTVQSIQYPLLKNAIIPVPPKEDRRRIIEAVKEALAKQSAIPSRLVSARRAIERFRLAILAAACSGRLTVDWRESRPTSENALVLLGRIEADRRRMLGQHYHKPVLNPSDLWEVPREWAWITPEQLRRPDRSLTYGVIKLGPPAPDGVPTLRSSDVRWLRIDEKHTKRIDKKIADNYKRTYLEGGEVLVTVRGTLGGVAVVPERMAGWNVSREVAVIPLRPVVHAPYVALAIGSSQSQRWMANVAKGVAYTGVNIEDLKKLPLPLPPVEEQIEISDRVERLLALADSLAHRIEAASHGIELSSRAVLAKAFRGELIAGAADDR